MRLGALLPRAVVVVLVWVLATAALTMAADRTNIIGPSPTASTGPAQPPNLVVPAVTGQVFVFAKGILEDAGFSWHVVGPVHGYPGNRVLTQSPAAGTHVVDTGAPTIVLHLAKGQYAQQGSPEDTSSYAGTRIEFPHAVATAPATKPAAKPKAKPAPKPKPKPAPKPATKPAKKTAPRPPAFTVAGGRKEPQNEISLPARTDKLAAWIATNPKRTNANVSRWLYQHAWIVDGAEFGWWHGSQALEKLIAVDAQVERIWGIGGKSEAVARAALANVRRHSR